LDESRGKERIETKLKMGVGARLSGKDRKNIWPEGRKAEGRD